MISTGVQKLRWDLPGDNSTCNDFAVGPDKALYTADTANSKIFKLPAGASAAELFLEHRALYGIDGVTFLNGTLYVNNVFQTISTESQWTLQAKPDNRSISGWISPSKDRTACVQPMAS